jgi:hypothetical protein
MNWVVRCAEMRRKSRAGAVWCGGRLLAVGCMWWGALSLPAQTNDPFCSPAATNQQSAGTIRMAARLRDLAAQIDPRDNPYMNSARANLLQQGLQGLPDAPDMLPMRIEFAVELARAGRTVEAVQEFQGVRKMMQSAGLQLAPQHETRLLLEESLAFLRMGEQENCLLNHTSESCLFPIGPGGVHRLPRGSQGAIQRLEELLRRVPNDLALRWLLNISHMTLAQYPEKLPPHLLISTQAFASDYPLPRFPEAAAAAGLDLDSLAGGCITEDFDGDGLLDVMVSAWDFEGQLRFFRNNGDGTFTERTREAGLVGLTAALNLLQTDYNNDGHLDVFMLRGAWLGKAGHLPNSLLRNNGNGTFEDVTEQAGLLSFHPTQTAAWFDFDGDGWLDLFIGNESYGTETHPSELFRNNGDGTFTECAAASGAAITSFIKGVASGDYDGDGRPDLYLSSRSGLNVLLKNEGPAPGHSRARPAWRFRDVAAEAGVGEPSSSFPAWFFDYDNDGLLDLLVTGYASTVADIAADYLGRSHRGERARLYRNRGDGKFDDVTRKVGLYKVLHAMGCNFGDLDMDGWLDFYLGTGDPDYATLIPNRAFRNDQGKKFQDVTTAGGFGHLQKGHGIAFADLDNDGDQDIYAVMGGAFSGDNYRNALFVNPGNSNRWLIVKLDGERSNRAAIGARLRVLLDTPAGERALYRTVGSGASFGASSLRQEIGLGDARAIKSVEVRWPGSGRMQTFTNLLANRAYRIRENAAQAQPWSIPTFQLSTNSHPRAHIHTHTLKERRHAL